MEPPDMDLNNTELAQLKADEDWDLAVNLANSRAELDAAISGVAETCNLMTCYERFLKRCEAAGYCMGAAAYGGPRFPFKVPGDYLPHAKCHCWKLRNVFNCCKSAYKKILRALETLNEMLADRYLEQHIDRLADPCGWLRANHPRFEALVAEAKENPTLLLKFIHEHATGHDRLLRLGKMLEQNLSDLSMMQNANPQALRAIQAALDLHEKPPEKVGPRELIWLAQMVVFFEEDTEFLRQAGVIEPREPQQRRRR